MKLIILKNNLKVGLDIVGRAVGSHLNLPVLGNVLIKAANNQIRLSATNLELAISKNIFGKIVEEGSLTIPYATISSIVNNLTSERVDLETNKQNGLIIKTDNYQAVIQGIPEEDFPIIPKVEKQEGVVEVNSLALKEGLDRVIVAGEISDLRPEISGVLFAVETTGLKLVATDSFRLAEARISSDNLKIKIGQGIKFTLPLRAAQELSRIIKEEEEAVFYLDQNQFLFQTKEIEFISRLIEGKFPDYEAIIPKTTETEVILKREELVAALKLAGVFVGRVSSVNLRIKDKKVVEVSSKDPAIGENAYLIPAKVNGPPSEVSFNWRYLMDGLKGGDTEQVILGLNHEDRPTVIKNPGDDSYLYLLMPIKTT
jgi:DNA polymerase-3 subunit beta